MLESFDEEALDMVRLKALRICAFHLQPQFLHPRGRHGVVGQRPPFQQVEKVPLVHGAIDHLE